MKFNIGIILILALFVPLVSCDDYLETESNSTFTEQSSFSNLDFATKAVLGIYSNFAQTHSYTYTLMCYYACDNDIEYVAGTDDASKRSLARYAGDEGNAYLAGPWTLIYQTIERANICIDNLPKSPIWDGEYASEAHRLYGEAKTLRALCYYDLLRHWGDVPFSIKSFQNGDNYYVPKTDMDEIYEYIIEDLAEAEEYLPWIKDISTSERMNKAFAKGLRARMALQYAGYSYRPKTKETRRGRKWEEYYKIAHQECEEIMESGKHLLNPDYVNIFKTIHAYSQDLQYGEVLFEIPYGRLRSGRVCLAIGMYFTVDPADPKYGRASTEVLTTPFYFYSFDTKDLRRNVSCELYSYSSASYPGMQRLVSTNSMRVSKWRKSWINPSMGGSLKEAQYTGVNWPLMRYSDVVLMFAETENELNGPTQAAKDALTSVRKRAFSSDLWDNKVTHYVDSVSASKEEFFNAIVNERKWEFGGEMIRKYDLVRWNLLGTKIREMKEENMKILNDDPKWKYLPNYIFWKYAADGETIEFLNQDYRLPSTNISGYTKNTWLSKASNSTFLTALERIASGYDEIKNNHLYPIGATIISDSNGVLSNE